MRQIFTFEPVSRQRNNPWDYGDDQLWLLLPEELPIVRKMYPHLVLRSIGNKDVSVMDTIDGDTRAGYLAYGILESRLPSVVLREDDPTVIESELDAILRKDSEVDSDAGERHRQEHSGDPGS